MLIMSLLLSFVLLFSYLLHRECRIKFANRFLRAENACKLQYPRFRFFFQLFILCFYLILCSCKMYLTEKARMVILEVARYCCVFPPRASYVFFKNVFILKFMKPNDVIVIKTRSVESPWENLISCMRSKALSRDYISKSRIQDYNSVL